MAKNQKLTACDKVAKSIMTKKGVAAAANAAAREVNAAVKELKRERQGIAAVVELIVNSDSAAAESIRQALNIAKGANKKARKALASDIMRNYPYVIRNIYVEMDPCEGDEVLEPGDCVPCTSTGKPVKDMLTAVGNWLKERAKIQAARDEYARKFWATIAARRAAGELTKENIERAYNFVRYNAPKKMMRQTIVGYVKIRK